MSKKYEKEFYNLFWIFFIGSIFGWIVEVIFSFVKYGVFINHSALVIGPFNIAYGLSALALTTLLFRYKDEANWELFLIGFLGGSIIEYVMSVGMELLLGFTSWDYSNKPLNLNGRICVRYSIFWGILSVFWIKVVYPRLYKMIEKIDFDFEKALIIPLIVFLLLDGMLTFLAVDRAKKKDLGIEAKYKYERILDNTFNKDYLKNMYNNSWGD